ncbi:MAG: MFS transporter [Spirochaetes bacterium]|nr:MFS transporter [Spirochaetota bacterium]
MKKYNVIFYYLAIANLSFFLGFAFYLLFPVFLKDMGASESFIGIMSSTDRIFTLITTLAFATFIRGRNKMKILRAGYVILVITFASYLLISSLTWYILIIRMIHGIGFAMAMVMGGNIIFDIVPLENAAEAIGIYGAIASLSNAISPFVGEVLLSNGFSFHFIFFISVILVFVSLLLTFIIPKIQAKDDKADPVKTGFLYLFKNSGFLNVSILSFIFGGAFGVITTYLPNFILATTNFKFSYFFVIFIAVLVIIRFRIIGRISMIEKNKLLIFMFVTGMLTNILLNHLNSMYIFILISVLYGLTHGILYPILNTMMVGLVPESHRSKANAFYAACFLGGGMIFSLILGFLIDYSGSYLVAFNVCAGAFLFGIILILINYFKNGSRHELSAKK